MIKNINRRTVALVVLCGITSSSGCTDDGDDGDDEGGVACYERLPDLDGDGVQSEDDCALADEAAITRHLCGLDRDLWRTVDDCAVQEIHLVDTVPASAEDVATYLQPSGDGASMFLVVTRDGLRVLVAPDAPTPVGTVGPANSTVWQFSAVPGSWGRAMTGTGFGFQRRLASTNTALWFDANDDHLAQASEVTDLRPRFGDNIEVAATLSPDPDLHRLVSVISAGVLTLWFDRNGNAQVDIGETIEVGDVARVLGIWSDGIVYLTQGEARYLPLDIWPPDLSRFQTLDIDHQHCDRYFRDGQCFDAGARQLVSYDSAGSMPTVTMLPALTRHVDLFGGLRAQILSFPGQPGAGVWEDRDSDLHIRDSEIATLPRTNRNFLIDSAMRERPSSYDDVDGDMVGVYAEGPDGNSSLITASIFAWRRRPAHHFLGDMCSSDAACAMGLTCEQSRRCVLAR